MIFGGIVPVSTIDFPKTLACVLFTRGCNMNCFYCHNRALLKSGGPVLAADDVILFLKKRIGLLDGVVISGGEPTLQDDLGDFLKELKSMGYLTKLDTNGSNPDTVMRLVKGGLLDYVAVDLKATENAYSWACAYENGFKTARETILRLYESDIDFEARTTLYPGLEPNELYDMLKSLPPLKRFRLNIFKMPEEYESAHKLLFRRAAISQSELDALMPRLMEVQPGVIS